MAGRLWRKDHEGSGHAGIVKQVAALRGELRLWQATLDHEVASIDRRLRDLEEVSAIAATEAQIVSRQVADLRDELRKGATILAPVDT